MNINKAKALQVGQQVGCPTDRGDSAYQGNVTWVGEHTSTNIYGHEYIWVEVQRPGSHKSMWPSNRLG
ncbi:hypothetical protein [Ferribacterium limneticum]|uniref:hypothetical protein n=1 Tax=Ferribacterium limneticum TaxID=76259 RepID=UPI001CF88A18|nr:hypothetical protein [Ferribacterium limneticum]UCV26733.1 hypothetical protein KI617_10470 [Ferribacterium limneticum]UCV30650.1 hypothetical protein KI608_10470 [Ferribacterium limneticum]